MVSERFVVGNDPRPADYPIEVYLLLVDTPPGLEQAAVGFPGTKELGPHVGVAFVGSDNERIGTITIGNYQDNRWLIVDGGLAGDPIGYIAGIVAARSDSWRTSLDQAMTEARAQGGDAIAVILVETNVAKELEAYIIRYKADSDEKATRTP